MARRKLPADKNLLASVPPLPLQPDHWQAIVAAMGLSEQLARVVELVLRDLSNKEIAAAMNLGEGTVKDYLNRIGQRTGTRGRVQLAVHVLTVSHQVLDEQRCLTKK